MIEFLVGFCFILAFIGILSFIDFFWREILLIFVIGAWLYAAYLIGKLILE